jgi:GNAT superfamily N-acetyltransferase
MFRRFQPDLLIFDFLLRLERAVRFFLPKWMLHPRWTRVYEMPVPRKLPEGRDDIEFRWATTEDIGLLESRFGEEVISTRLSFGHRAAMLVKDGELIGAAFFATRGYYDIDTGTRITLSFDETWMYGAWIHRRHRGHHLYSLLLDHVAVDLRHRGIRQILLALELLNVRAHRLHRAKGAKPIGKIYGVRLANYKIYRYSRIPFIQRS